MNSYDLVVCALVVCDNYFYFLEKLQSLNMNYSFRVLQNKIEVLFIEVWLYEIK